MSESIEVYAVGSEVLLDGSVSAHITAVFIRENHLGYEVVWWNNRERHVEVVEHWEIQPDNEKTKAQRICQIL